MHVTFNVRTDGGLWGTNLELEIVEGHLALTSVPGHIVESLLFEGLLDRGEGRLPEYESEEFQAQAKALLKMGFFRSSEVWDDGTEHGILAKKNYLRLWVVNGRNKKTLFEGHIKGVEATVLDPV